ncbi:hypothetical protein [Nocardioides convexus]|uniref:hypothetical protein n=1 Tax=Nocardioides convexus TaxID=2712224 RepID=UPI0024184B12|nr:hypothetical protein [Nocardioides convexus]
MHPAGEAGPDQALLDGVRRGEVVGADQVAHGGAGHPRRLGGGQALDGGGDRFR